MCVLDLPLYGKHQSPEIMQNIQFGARQWLTVSIESILMSYRYGILSVRLEIIVICF